jgi:hypothetical protein
MELPAGVLLLLLAMVSGGGGSAWENERRKRKMTSGAHTSTIGERGCNEVYIFVYACSWAQVVSIRIMWHSCGKRRIVMVRFKIGK